MPRKPPSEHRSQFLQHLTPSVHLRQMSQRRYTDEDKARWLYEFATHGGTAAAFCRKRGLSYQSFMQWRRAAGGAARAEPAANFVEIDFAPRRETASVVGTLVELDFGGGLVLRIRPLHAQPLPKS